MIYIDRQLKQWALNGGITPYLEDCINPASIDLRLGGTFIDLGTCKRDRFSHLKITISPGDAILATTMEYIVMPSNAAGVVYLKSSLARQGLDHALAGFVDPGFKGQLTLELHAHYPVTLTAGQRVVQLVLYQTEEPDKIYNGRYQGQRGPTIAR